MFDKQIRRPEGAGAFGGRGPGSAVRGTGVRGRDLGYRPNMAGVRGAMARGAHAGACCPAGAGSRMTVLGPDSFPVLAAGARVTLQFTPYCTVEGARFYLPPNIGNLVDVASMKVIGCNALGGKEPVPGETFTATNSGDMGCALTKIPGISSDNPLEVELIGRAGIGAGEIIPYAALIGEDNRLVGKMQGQVAGAHAAGCCEDKDPTRNTVLGSTQATLVAGVTTSADLEVKPYCRMEGIRAFSPESQAVNLLVNKLEVNGCNYLGGKGKVPAEVFMNSMDPDFCFPLDQIGCIDSTSPLIIGVELKTDAALEGALNVRFTLFGRDSRDNCEGR